MAEQDATTSSLAAALAAAQGEMPTVKEDAKNPHYQSKFMSLDNLIATTRPILAKYGLALTQFPTVSELGAPVLRTILLHGETGERLEADMPLWVDGQSMQKLGSAITYARRYAWAAVLGVAAEEDTDGEPPAAPAPKVISEAQRRRLFAAAKEHQVDDDALRDIIRGVTGVPSTKSITADKYDQIVDLVEQQDVPF